MRDGDDGARVLGEVPLEPRDGLGVEVVGRLVEEQQVRLLEEDLAERDAALLAARDLRHVGVGRRQAQRVHRDLELAVELPRVGRLDRVLDALVLGHDLLALGLRELLGELLVELLEALEQAARLRDALPRRCRGRPWSCRAAGPAGRKPTRVPSAGNASPAKSFSTPAMIFSSVDLPAPFKPRTPIFAPGQEREVDALQDLALRRDDLPQVDHRVDVLVCHRSGGVYHRSRRRRGSGLADVDPHRPEQPLLVAHVREAGRPHQLLDAALRRDSARATPGCRGRSRGSPWKSQPTAGIIVRR